MKAQIAGLMQQAKKMQEEMAKAQEELARTEVTGQAGGGMVKVTMNGRHEVRRVEIDRKVLAEDPEMTEDLVAAAINDAVNRIGEASRERMAGLGAGLNLPPGMKFPF
ncbi:MAG TPA: YbaB/EbfC family nucleoid-associated protein [Xanthomonadaceae bacterium]|nr:YbaB/EbfC family nucleoid-associated protein [Xanthomonadaceae bacterium]